METEYVSGRTKSKFKLVIPSKAGSVSREQHSQENSSEEEYSSLDEKFGMWS